MTRVQQSAAGMLFAAVLILGGWAWSQDDPVTSPSDVTGAAVDPETAGAETADPATADPETETGDPKTAEPTADTPATDPTSLVDSAGGAAPTRNVAATAGLRGMMYSLWIFALAVYLGIEVISKVPPTLHTPLMSGSNAISGITLVGAVIVAAAVANGVSSNAGVFARFLGFIAVALAMINAVGGFLVTHRMLAMFKRK